MDHLSRELVHLGLSEKEAAVYVAALQLGPALAQDIAKKSEVNRATTYVMMESLAKRGLISSTEKDKKRIFIAESPDRLLSLLHLQKKELEEQEEEINKMLPKLHAVFNRSGEKPDVRYFEGMDGLETLRRGYENLQGETVQIIGYDACVKVIEFDATKQHRDKLNQDHAPIRALIISERSKGELQNQFWEGFDFHVIAPSAFPMKVEGEITVRADHVHMFTYSKGPLAIDVRSSVLADTFRALFEIAWRGGK